MRARERRARDGDRSRREIRGRSAEAAGLKSEIFRVNGSAENGRIAHSLAGLEAAFSLERRDQGLRQARKMRDAILVLVALLGELDDLGPGESDDTAFAEVAGLFEDVRDFALCGAGARRLVGPEQSRTYR